MEERTDVKYFIKVGSLYLGKNGNNTYELTTKRSNAYNLDEAYYEEEELIDMLLQLVNKLKRAGLNNIEIVRETTVTRVQREKIEFKMM